MKYFRKHPDLIIIANFPEGTRRVRHGRQTTPQELSKILIQTMKAKLRDKKILLLTDAADSKKHARLIIRTCWKNTRPLTLRHLWHRIIYNYQASTICILYHPVLFGALLTPILMPILLIFLRATGKRVVLIFLTTPALSPHPKLSQAILYFLNVSLRALLSFITSQTIPSEQSRAVGTLKKRSEVGKYIAEELFPSPTKNLGLLGA